MASEHIPAAHTMVPWLVSWAADAILKYRVKESGKTAYEEITGHKVKHVVAAFGESVQFRVATDPHDQNKYDGEWQDGYFAGVCHRSSECLVIYKDRIFKCPTIRRRVSAEAYRRACLTDMNADFYEYILKGALTSRAVAVEGGNRFGGRRG